MGRLAELWTLADRERYVEPFAGSAALFCHIEPNQALIGDFNSELIATYMTVRDAPRKVAARLRQWRGDRDTYYRLRKRRPETLVATSRAARFLYLNRWCFNGLYRTNRDGHFNVPFGGDHVAAEVSPEHLEQFACLMRRATLVAADYESTLSQVRPSDFVYLDPPYSVQGKRMFAEYVNCGFGPQDVDRLGAWLRKLDRLGAKFAVSYAASAEGRELARGYSVERLTVQRNVGGFTSRRRKTIELLLHNCG